MGQYYLWYKSLHVIAVICWMAAIFYMPRLFVYHSKVEKGSNIDEIFKIMEDRLLKIIMRPAMVATYIFGLINTHIYGLAVLELWFYIKMLAVLGLTIVHIMQARWVKAFARGENKHSENFYRIFNEIPTLLMVVAVIMVIVKPFE